MDKRFTDMHSLFRGFANAMNLVCPEVKNYHQRIAYLCYHIAEEMELNEQERRLAVFGALTHSIGSIAQSGNYGIGDVKANAAKLAGVGRTVLRMLSEESGISEVVEYSEKPWQKLLAIPGKLTRPMLIGQVLRLSEKVTSMLLDNEPALNQVKTIMDAVRETEGKEFRAEILQALERTAHKDAVWLNLLYCPDAFSELLPGNRDVPLDEVVQLTEAVSLIIDFKSPFTAMHSAGVAASAEAMAKLMCLSGSEQQMMRIAANLHDLGKLKIPTEILEKNGKLTDEEFNIIKEHAFYTYIILKDIAGFEDIARWAGFHHEKPNGQGYPFGLRDEEIPLGAKILSVADVFAAITEERPYRKGLQKDDAIGILRENAASGALCSDIVERLIARYDEVDRIRDKASREAGKRYFASLEQT